LNRILYSPQIKDFIFKLYVLRYTFYVIRLGGEPDVYYFLENK
jgi:hypothetical protein